MTNKRDKKGRILKPNEDQLSDGRYRYRYCDANGKRKACYSWKLVRTDKTPIGRKDTLSLREQEQAIERDVADGIDTTSSKMTVEKLMELFYEVKAEMAKSTKESRRYCIRVINEFPFAKMQIGKVKKSDVLTFYAQLKKERKLQNSTLHMYHQVLSGAFALAVEDHVLRSNPCKGCLDDYEPEEEEEKEPLSVEEQYALMEFLKESRVYSKYFFLIAFLLSTGCRIGEALGLTWDDVSFKKRSVSINHQLQHRHIDGKYIFYITGIKNKMCREIPLQDEIYEILLEQYEIYKKNPSSYTLDGYGNFVFRNKNDTVHSYRTIRNAFANLVGAHNEKEEFVAEHENRTPVLLPEFTPHVLRHTFCTRMQEAGMDLAVLRQIMGHKSLEMTVRRYTHVKLPRMKEVMQKMPSMLSAS